jgi:hypothetical protein
MIYSDLMNTHFQRSNDPASLQLGAWPFAGNARNEAEAGAVSLMSVALELLSACEKMGKCDFWIKECHEIITRLNLEVYQAKTDLP